MENLRQEVKIFSVLHMTAIAILLQPEMSLDHMKPKLTHPSQMCQEHRPPVSFRQDPHILEILQDHQPK